MVLPLPCTPLRYSGGVRLPLPWLGSWIAVLTSPLNSLFREVRRFSLFTSKSLGPHDPPTKHFFSECLGTLVSSTASSVALVILSLLTASSMDSSGPLCPSFKQLDNPKMHRRLAAGDFVGLPSIISLTPDFPPPNSLSFKSCCRRRFDGFPLRVIFFRLSTLTAVRPSSCWSPALPCDVTWAAVALATLPVLDSSLSQDFSSAWGLEGLAGEGTGVISGDRGHSGGLGNPSWKNILGVPVAERKYLT